MQDGLIINVGQSTTHLMPILNGKLKYESTTRISIGSSHSQELLRRSLTQRFPQHKGLMTPQTI